jgi:hypothetical protein
LWNANLFIYYHLIPIEKLVINLKCFGEFFHVLKYFLHIVINFNNHFVTPIDTSFLRFLKLTFNVFNALLSIISFGVSMPFFYKYNHNSKFLILTHYG